MEKTIFSKRVLKGFFGMSSILLGGMTVVGFTNQIKGSIFFFSGMIVCYSLEEVFS